MTWMRALDASAGYSPIVIDLVELQHGQRGLLLLMLVLLGLGVDLLLLLLASTSKQANRQIQDALLLHAILLQRALDNM